MEFDDDKAALISLIVAFVGIYYVQRYAITNVKVKWIKYIPQKANKDAYEKRKKKKKCHFLYFLHFEKQSNTTKVLTKHHNV